MAKLEGEFEVTSWDEDTYQKLQGERKLTKASVTQKFTGDLAGSGSVEWLMFYADDGKSTHPFRVSDQTMVNTVSNMVEYGGLDPVANRDPKAYYTNDYLPK